VGRKLGGMPEPPAPAADAVDRAAVALQRASSPVLLLGGGAVDAYEDIRALVEALDIPTAMTVNAKGLLPPGHPLSLGSFQSMPAVRALIASADVVLAIGTELGETDYDTLAFDGNFGIHGTLIRVDIDAEQLHRVALVGDGGLQFTLGELGAAVEARVGIAVVLWNNAGYGEIKRYMLQRNIEPQGVDIHTPDFLKLAEGFGCEAARADSVKQLRELLRAAAQAMRPSIIEIAEGADFLTSA
jgi:thiamine pyrophosphate-dependent acetolactate synthase large subunit-like protein